MSINELRHKNLMALLAQIEDETGNKRGAIKQLSLKSGISEAQLSHLKTTKRNIGHKTARTIELAMGKEAGWLDVSHDDLLPSDSEEREHLELALTLYRRAPDQAKKSMLELMKEVLWLSEKERK